MPVTVRRKDELLRKLGQLAPATGKALAEANKQSADEMVSLARSFAPVRSGKLRDSIVATPAGGTPPAHSQGGGAGVVPEGAVAVSAGNSSVRYASHVEHGTSPHDNEGRFKGTQHPGAKRQPFFFPAYRLIRKKMRSRASRSINKAIKEVAAK